MTNIQLYQKFTEETTFDKTHRVPLGHLVTFADLINKLTEAEIDDVIYAIGMISEYREKEQAIPEHQRTN